MMNRKKILSILLVMSLSLGMTSQTYATDVEKAQQEIDALEAQEAEAQAEADEIEEETEAAKEELASLKKKLNKLADEMEQIERDIDDKEDEIRDKEEELVQSQITERQQYSSMKKRIRFMYENGDTELIEVLFASQSMSDFLNNVEYIKSISEYDRNMLIEYQAIVTQVKEEKLVLEEEYKDLEKMQDKLIAKQEEIQALYKEKAAEIKNLDQKLAETNDRLAKLAEAAAEATRKKEEAIAAQKAAEEAAAKAKAEAEAAEKARQQQAAEQTPSQPSEPAASTGTGQMTHPCPGATLSSSYGGRSNPTGYGYQFHKGIDLAAPMGTPYYAADSGTVVIAGYSASAGNWIVIDHGGGVQTYYMHSSAIYVSAGQTVSKGQNIGAVGSTGDSTGPHLHFQVVVNGVDTNPYNYL